MGVLREYRGNSCCNTEVIGVAYAIHSSVCCKQPPVILCANHLHRAHPPLFQTHTSEHILVHQMRLHGVVLAIKRVLTGRVKVKLQQLIHAPRNACVVVATGHVDLHGSVPRVEHRSTPCGWVVKVNGTHALAWVGSTHKELAQGHVDGGLAGANLAHATPVFGALELAILPGAGALPGVGGGSAQRAGAEACSGGHTGHVDERAALHGGCIALGLGELGCQVFEIRGIAGGCGTAEGGGKARSWL